MTPIFLTTPELLEQHWDSVARCLQPLADKSTHGEFDIADLRVLCEAKRAYAVVVSDDSDVVLAMVYKFAFYPKFTSCYVLAIGGRALDEIVRSFFVTFKKWLYGMGVTVIEASCSSAMSRVLARYGFGKIYEVVRHEITVELPDHCAE